MYRRLFGWIAALIISANLLHAENASKPISDPVLDTPTLRSLGAYWLIQGDDNRNARVECQYRKAGGEWKRGPDLFRVAQNPRGVYKSQGGKPKEVEPKVPQFSWLFAGSLVLLEPDTAYEWKLKLIDPDGGEAEKTLQAHTIGEPKAPEDLVTLHVVPPAPDGKGEGEGDGSAEHPFVGLNAAQKAAKPGTLFLLGSGTYKTPFIFEKSGEPGHPIIWRGKVNGEVVLDAGAPKDKLVGSPACMEVFKQHDLWFENLMVRGAHNLMRAHGSYRIVVRRCYFYEGICGMYADGELDNHLGPFFISDNTFEGTMPWPITKAQYDVLPESRAIWIGGSGNVVCYNRIHHWKDGMDNADSPHCDSNDFHNNEVSECFDDGTEMDGSVRNTRCFLNRYTNVFQGISFQPIYGGPAYAFRNVIYNVQVEPFKLHNVPSGAVLIHNTIVKHGAPIMLMTEDSPINCFTRNNLFIGTEGRALSFDPYMEHCDFDYDGFGGASGDIFMKWNNKAYKSLDDVHKLCEVEKHCVVVDPKTAFFSGVQPPESNQTVFDAKIGDVRLKEGTGAIDVGEVLPGFNDGFVGKAPDLGAFEFGEKLPQYGPRR